MFETHSTSIARLAQGDYLREEKIRKICSSLVRKFTADEAYLEQELKHALPRVQCLALIPEHMTGKLVNES